MIGRRPRLLDLFCGAGGAAMGYHRAGFDVVGVDIAPQPNYPFEFVQADAVAMLHSSDCIGWWRTFDAIHASPPCQFYSRSMAMHDRTVHPDLIADVRRALIFKGIPWVIENVPGAPLQNAVMICGSGLGMRRIRRHRLFEASFPMFGVPCAHGQNRDLLNVTGHSESGRRRRVGPGWLAADKYDAMGIDWMNRDELSQAIPPAYTEHVGVQLLAHLRFADESVNPDHERTTA